MCAGGWADFVADGRWTVPSSDSPLPSHDPRENIEREEALALLALNEPIPAQRQAHIDACAQCQAELAALRRTVHLARDAAVPSTRAAAPPAAWQHTPAELALDEPPAHRPGRRRRVRPLGAPRSWPN